jgi:hypothetical protein
MTEVAVANSDHADESAEDAPADESAEEEPAEGLWHDVQLAPVEIALPGGVGFTLRAYRLSTDLAGLDSEGHASSDRDAFDDASAKVLAGRGRGGPAEEEDELTEVDDDLDDEDLDDDDLVDDEEDEDEDEELPVEEVPVFLGRRGRLYLFHNAEKLVEFVQSDAEHDLTQLDTWPELVRRLEAADIEPAEEDSYELDLVVENLRGGHDAWDGPLIIKAGEIARDLGYALRLEPIVGALSAGSPLDDLDEALRTVESGGPKAFFGRRKVRKVGEQQATLGWRTIIGKIAAVVDWRD